MENSLNEEVNRIKELLVEQGSGDYNCEIDAATGDCNCVPNLIGCGQFPSLSDCQSNTNPNIGPGCPQPEPCCGVPVISGCEGAPTLNCWFCLHYPGGHCLSFQDYYTFGSGAPGMTPTQQFMDTQVFQDQSNPGVYLSHQGGAIYDNEADCVASGCNAPQSAGCTDPAATNYDPNANVDDGSCIGVPIIDPNRPTSATKPGIKDDKFRGNKFRNTKERMGEGISTRDEIFNSLLVEQGSGDYNCEVDATTGGCNCVSNLIGCGQYPTLSDCQNDTNPNTGTGCPPSQPCCSQACPAFHSFHSWFSGYPTGGSDFTWTGPSIVNLGGWGSPINYPTGSVMPASIINWFNAGQSSYCEWCADYLSGGVSAPNAYGFDIRTNYWAGGPYGPEACDCCPGSNGVGPPLPLRIGAVDYYSCDNDCRVQTNRNDSTDPFSDPKTFATKQECMDSCGRNTDDHDPTCCDWCQMSGGIGRPPRGCKDWMCDNCNNSDYERVNFDLTINEEVNRIKELLVEQGSGDYNCEIDAATGDCNCVPNLIGCGQFPSLLDCQNNTNPNTGPGCPPAESCCEDPDDRFTCYDDGTCQVDPNGPFTSMNDCLDNCTPTASCVHGSSGGRECYYCPGITKQQQADQDIRLNEKYKPNISPVRCKMVGNDIGRLTDGTNLYDSMLACETAESECVDPGPPPMEECHCCTTGGASAAYTQNMGFFSVGNCNFCNTSACNPWNPGSGTLYSNFWNCAPISQGPLNCSIVNPPWTPKIKPTDDEKFRGR